MINKKYHFVISSLFLRQLSYLTLSIFYRAIFALHEGYTSANLGGYTCWVLGLADTLPNFLLKSALLLTFCVQNSTSYRNFLFKTHPGIKNLFWYPSKHPLSISNPSMYQISRNFFKLIRPFTYIDPLSYSIRVHPLGNGQKLREGVEYIFRKSKIFLSPSSSIFSGPLFWGFFVAPLILAPPAQIFLCPTLSAPKIFLPPQILHLLSDTHELSDHSQ